MTHLVQPWEPNLWAMLKSAGYTTLHFGKNDMLAQASFPPSFNYWEDGTGVSQGPCPYAFGEAGYYSFAAGPGSSDGNVTAANGDLRAVRHALAALGSGNVSEPFALFLPGLGAHPPYGMPRDYVSRGRGGARCLSRGLQASALTCYHSAPYPPSPPAEHVRPCRHRRALPPAHAGRGYGKAALLWRQRQ